MALFHSSLRPVQHAGWPEATTKGARMRVRIKGDISGTRNDKPWPARGEEIDLPDDEGAVLCAQGIAEPVAKRDADKVEKAVAPEPEKRGPGRPRKAEE